ncbi:MAG: hypothetical protein ACRDZO_14350 [Egibacteraceae bacterium]
MSDGHGKHPDSERVDNVPEGEAIVAFTPCHDARVLLPLDEAVPGIVLDLFCPKDGRKWLLQLVTDEGAESGLRPVWTDPKQDPEKGEERCFLPCRR